ncbi:ubiquinone biosynthesis O-methyltransferase, mitochondrial [Iris pallida]|uniref:Ubiquinone biosynthesis O-methyltransferase, mitochondrial n=1 Tax=Iris pallida TaxID=29817 RepID=A0AAX6DX43_IRIPA|nr:ubiquinone biosynthesis O-methyltransferase, mitochondrial [Iris pallida]
MAGRSFHRLYHRHLLRSITTNPNPNPSSSPSLRSFRCLSNTPPPPPPPESVGGVESPPPPPRPPPDFRSSLNEAEVAKFAAIADTWWDFEGPFKPLHAMNPTRVSFIRSALCRHFRKDPNCARPFEGLKIIDVGCGGGILSEPLARMGATVAGIDAVEKNIKIARIHAGLDPLTSTIDYSCATAEQLVRENKKFDVVIASEVIEHVADPAEFCKSLSSLTVPSGATVISTINRSVRSYAAAIVVAEYLLSWLPKGTHEWSKFLTPEELAMILQRASISVQEMAGMVYNPLTGEWSLSDDTSINFIVLGTKEGKGDLMEVVPQ